MILVLLSYKQDIIVLEGFRPERRRSHLRIRFIGHTISRCAGKGVIILVEIPNVVHSFPTWTMSRRPTHSKFGGKPTDSGIASVATRLHTINKECPGVGTSLHLLFELATDNPKYAKLNSPDAITMADLLALLGKGECPQIMAVIAPAFGDIPGIEYGAILSPDPEIRAMAKALHEEARDKTRQLRDAGFGKGLNIWWPAYDSWSERYRNMATSDNGAWDMLVDFWSNHLSDHDGLVHLEWKPSVPGDRDYINSVRRAIEFCLDVNSAVGGEPVMVINHEWAHGLIGGTSVFDCTRLIIEAGLFTGFCHANSAEKAVFIVDEETGQPLLGTPGDDKDWPVGVGGDDIWADQQAAVGLMLRSGVPELIFEHDLDPAGTDPEEYFETSRINLDRMISAESK